MVKPNFEESPVPRKAGRLVGDPEEFGLGPEPKLSMGSVSRPIMAAFLSLFSGIHSKPDPKRSAWLLRPLGVGRLSTTSKLMAMKTSANFFRFSRMLDNSFVDFRQTDELRERNQHIAHNFFSFISAKDVGCKGIGRSAAVVRRVRYPKGDTKGAVFEKLGMGKTQEESLVEMDSQPKRRDNSHGICFEA